MNYIKKIKRRLYTFFVKKRNPLKYARKIGVNVGENVHIYGDIRWGTEPWIINIGNNVHLTDGIRFFAHDGATILFRDKYPDIEITKPISIGNNVYIGNNVLILPGVNIGDNVIIGAGAIVSRDIPDNSVAVGIPARVIKTFDEYGIKAQTNSLHLGNLKGEEKDKALKKYYNYSGKSKGIYF